MANKQQKKTRRMADKQGMVECPMHGKKVNTTDTCDECEHEMNRNGRIVNCDYMEEEKEEEE